MNFTMRVNKLCSFDRSHLFREPIKVIEPDLQKVTSNYDDETGFVSHDIESVPYSPADDVRVNFRDSDFSLSVIIANDALKTLKPCKLDSDRFQNADNIDSTLECVDSLRQSAEIIVESSKDIE